MSGCRAGCGGKRLKPESTAVTIGGLDISTWRLNRAGLAIGSNPVAYEQRAIIEEQVVKSALD